jgi:hypothetical protein
MPWTKPCPRCRSRSLSRSSAVYQDFFDLALTFLAVAGFNSVGTGTAGDESSESLGSVGKRQNRSFVTFAFGFRANAF